MPWPGPVDGKGKSGQGRENVSPINSQELGNSCRIQADTFIEVITDTEKRLHVTWPPAA